MPGQESVFTDTSTLKRADRPSDVLTTITFPLSMKNDVAPCLMRQSNRQIFTFRSTTKHDSSTAASVAHPPAINLAPPRQPSHAKHDVVLARGASLVRQVQAAALVVGSADLGAFRQTARLVRLTGHTGWSMEATDCDSVAEEMFRDRQPTTRNTRNSHSNSKNPTHHITTNAP